MRKRCGQGKPLGGGGEKPLVVFSDSLKLDRQDKNPGGADPKKRSEGRGETSDHPRKKKGPKGEDPHIL